MNLPTLTLALVGLAAPHLFGISIPILILASISSIPAFLWFLMTTSSSTQVSAATRTRINTAIYAATASNLVNLATDDLLTLNSSGSFFNGFLLLTVEALSSKFRDHKVDVTSELDCFRTVFLGVWTSFSGFCVLTSFKESWVYLFANIFATVFSHELGLRASSFLFSKYTKSQRKYTLQFLVFCNFILPYLSIFLFSFSSIYLHKPRIVLAASLSILGTFFGEIISRVYYLIYGSSNDVSDNIYIPFNILTSTIASGVVFYIKMNKISIEDKPYEGLVNEFVESFLGSASAFTNTSEIFHTLFLILCGRKFINMFYRWKPIRKYYSPIERVKTLGVANVFIKCFSEVLLISTTKFVAGLVFKDEYLPLEVYD
eukprot:snap_masked-scaffold_14-processed-gene-8.28-mRNA-1 protein AED:0.98 eAED:1.00 QI:0/0/0/0.5/1/1/2/0/372